MLHYKAFTSADCNDNIAAFEQSVNEWMEQERPYVHTMTQSSFGAHVVISFLYETDADAEREERVAVATAAPEVFEEALRESDLDPADQLLVTLLPHAELPY